MGYGPEDTNLNRMSVNSKPRLLNIISVFCNVIGISRRRRVFSVNESARNEFNFYAH